MFNDNSILDLDSTIKETFNPYFENQQKESKLFQLRPKDEGKSKKTQVKSRQEGESSQFYKQSNEKDLNIKIENVLLDVDEVIEETYKLKGHYSVYKSKRNMKKEEITPTSKPSKNLILQITS